MQMLKSKRVLSMVLALLMMLSLVTGIVLPAAAEVVPQAEADPYKMVTDGATLIETIDGVDIYKPADNVWFVDHAWGTAWPNGVAEGATFDYKYGDGVTWGNGVTYRLTRGVNSFKYFEDYKAAILEIDPLVQNKIIVLYAPGKYEWSIGDHVFKAPAGIDDPTQEEMLNVYMFGPQAGKSPVTEKGSKEVANNRSDDIATEFVFGSTFWLPTNAVWHMDGFAANEKFKFYSAWTDTVVRKGIHLDNFYMELDENFADQWGGKRNALFEVGFDDSTNKTVVDFRMKNAFIKNVTKEATLTSNNTYNKLQANIAHFENVVFSDFKGANSGNDRFRLRVSPSEVSASNINFLGEYKGKYSLKFKDCSIMDYNAQFFMWCTIDRLEPYGAKASIDWEDNYIKNFGLLANAWYQFISFEGNGAAGADDWKFNFLNNYVELSPNVAGKNSSGGVFLQLADKTKNGKAYNLRGNTFKIDTIALDKANWLAYADVNNNVEGKMVIDMGGNLFLGSNNTVRAFRGYAANGASALQNNVNVISDIYASDEMAGGIKEIFNVTKSPEDLFVCHSQIQTLAHPRNPGHAEFLLGTITVFPKDGVEYDATNLFTFGDKRAELVGVYPTWDDVVAETNALETIEKGFERAYVKARYKAGNTTATVIYTMVEPNKFNVVAPAGTTEYTFNGTTYSSADENVSFFTKITDAANSIQNSTTPQHEYVRPRPIVAWDGSITPLYCVNLIAPGTYAEWPWVGRITCFIGAGFGRDPYVEGSKEVANGRGVDPTTETVFNGTFQVAQDGYYNDPYVSIAGISFTGKDTDIAMKVSGASARLVQQICHLNVFQCYSNTANYLLTNHGHNVSQDAVQIYVNYDNCYLAKTGPQYVAEGPFTDLTYTDSFISAGVADSWTLIYKLPLNGNNFNYKPLKDSFTIDNCYVDASMLTANSYLFTNTAQDPAPVAGKRGIEGAYAEGTYTYFTNNIVETTNEVYRFMPFGEDKYHIIFTDNLIKHSTNWGPRIINDYVRSGVAADLKLTTADISRNVILGNCFAWNFGDTTGKQHINSVNVDENFYGDATGKPWLFYNGNYGAVKDESWYYLDKEMTTKTSEVQLANGTDYTVTHGNVAVKGGVMMNVAAVKSTKNISTADLVSKDGSTVKGVYTDATMATPVTGVINKTGTYYALVEKDATGISALTEVTVEVPCNHEAFSKVAGTRVEPTCGTDGYQEYTCSNCSVKIDAWTETLTATGAHVWDSGVVDTEPTCQVMGKTLYTCTATDCKADGSKATKVEQDIPVVPCESDGTWHVTLAPKCEEKGTEIQKCKWCGAQTAIRDINPTGHDWDDGVENPIHNCLKDGVMNYTCKNDPSHTYTEVVYSTGDHNFVGLIQTPATCTTVGKIVYTCGGCNASHIEDIPMTGHNYASVTTKEPTCTEDGVLTHTCQNAGCGHTYTSVLPSNGSHDFKAEVLMEPTCTEDGAMQYTCQRASCGLTTVEPIPNKGGHQWGVWALEKESTCTVQGTDIRACLVCGETEQRNRDLLPHDFEAEFTIDRKPTGTVEGIKSRHCKDCTAVTDVTNMGYCTHRLDDKTWTITLEPTCTAEGSKHQTCADCGDPINVTAIEMIPHNIVSSNVTLEPECTVPGSVDNYCDVCETTYTEVLPELGHNEGVWETETPATCTTSGTAVKKCQRCTETLETKDIPATEHACGYEWVEITPAGCVTDGYAEYACKDCGFVTDSKVLPAVGHNDVFVETIAPTCTDKGSRVYTCTTCNGPIIIEIDALGHKPGKWEVSKIATTLAPGERVKKCTTCGEVVVRDVTEQIVSSGSKFKDVPANAWYKKAVDFVYGSGLMNGVSSTEFAPNASTTRGMFVTILGRLSGVDASKYTKAYFEDVKDGSYYFGYIEWARVNGIVDGTGNYVFEPDRAITRQEMCKIIYSYAKYEGINIVMKNAKVTYKDDAKIAKWAKSYVYNCQRSNIAKGDNGYFRPTDTAKRSEIAQLIMNFYVNFMK